MIKTGTLAITDPDATQDYGPQMVNTTTVTTPADAETAALAEEKAADQLRAGITERPQSRDDRHKRRRDERRNTWRQSDPGSTTIDMATSDADEGSVENNDDTTDLTPA